MKFQELLSLVGDEPLFSTDVLLAGAGASPAAVRLQLSRWVRQRKLILLRRGLYALAPPYQRVQPHPFLIANYLQRPSYVSLQSALAHYGLIPEFTPVVTSVTTGRPRRWQTGLGQFEFRHIKKPFWFGFQLTDLGQNQSAFLATPEKALLDLIHLQPGGDSTAYLQELRLQHLHTLDWERLHAYVERMNAPKLHRALQHLHQLHHTEEENYEPLRSPISNL